MTDEYRALIADLEAEHAELDGVVAALSETEWATLTPAEGWTVRATILHLALTDDVAALAAADPVAFQAYRERGRAGSEPFESQRNMPSDELLDLWHVNRARLLDALRSVDSRARITWFGPPMSAMSHATARLMETWAHGQDVLDALGLERTPTPRLRHIAHLGVRTRAYSYQQHGLTAPATDVHVALAAPGHATATGGDPGIAAPGDGRWTWGNPAAVDHVTGPALDFCLVVVQRRHLDDTLLQAEGPHAREWLLIAQAYAGRAGAGRRPGQFKQGG